MTTKRLSIVVVLLLLLAGCAGGDDRRTGALEEGAKIENLSWHGDYAAEATYPAGSMVTHEGSTFIAVSDTDQAPDPRCEAECPWTLTGVAASSESTGDATLGELKVFDYSTGYDGPLESPIDHLTSLPVLQMLTQAANKEPEIKEWAAKIAPWVIRHRSDEGSVIGERSLPAGTYLVFARGVFVSSPGLGKNPAPQTLGGTVGTMINPIVGALKPIVGGLIKSRVLGYFPGSGLGRDYSLACALGAGGKALDSAALTLSETSTANTSLMGLAVLDAPGKAEVSCAHNGSTAGPFVRDLRLIALKLT